VVALGAVFPTPRGSPANALKSVSTFALMRLRQHQEFTRRPAPGARSGASYRNVFAWAADDYRRPETIAISTSAAAAGAGKLHAKRAARGAERLKADFLVAYHVAAGAQWDWPNCGNASTLVAWRWSPTAETRADRRLSSIRAPTRHLARPRPSFGRWSRPGVVDVQASWTATASVPSAAARYHFSSLNPPPLNTACFPFV